MTSNFRAISLLVSLALVHSGLATAQEAAPKFKLTIVDNAGTTKRAQRGRMSSQAAVKVTDENDRPIAGVAVTFAIPQFVGGGASFANGVLSSVVLTDAAGLATSGSFVATTGTTFSIGASATVSGATLTTSVPINTAALVAASGGAAAGGVSAGLIAGIVGAVAAGAIVAVKVASGGGGSGGGGGGGGGGGVTPPTGTIGGPGGVMIGGPR